MRRSILCVSTLVVLTGCALNEGEVTVDRGVVEFPGAAVSLDVRIADSAGEQQRGLMGVEHLETDHGMAFVYDEPTASSFWMKDTLIPLSIAFVDERGRIVGIEEMRPCSTDPCPTWDAGGARYTLAIEANAGWFAEHGIGVGDRARLETHGYL